MKLESDRRAELSFSARFPMEAELLLEIRHASQRSVVGTSSMKCNANGRSEALFAAQPPMEVEFAASVGPRSRGWSARGRSVRDCRFGILRSGQGTFRKKNRARSAEGKAR
jgi:hypothetical protein